MNSLNIKSLVKSIVTKHNTNDPQVIACKENIHIIEGQLPLPNGIDGIAANVMGVKSIYLTSGLNEKTRKEVIAKGLGIHLLEANLESCMITNEDNQIQRSFKKFYSFLVESNVVNFERKSQSSRFPENNIALVL